MAVVTVVAVGSSFAEKNGRNRDRRFVDKTVYVQVLPMVRHFFRACVCVCAHGRACVRERARGGVGGGLHSFLHSFDCCVCTCACAGGEGVEAVVCRPKYVHVRVA